MVNRLSQPCALVGSSDFIIGNVSFSVAWKQFILLFFLSEKDGRVLVFFIGVHIDRKKK